MSLLGDALKRHQQERGGDTSFPRISGAVRNAWSEPGMKDAVTPPWPESPKRKPRAPETRPEPPAPEWAAGVLVGVGLLVVVAGLGWPYYLFLVRTPSEPGVEQAVEEQAVAWIAPDPALVTDPATVAVEVPPEAAPVALERIEQETPDVSPVDEVVVPEFGMAGPEPETEKWPYIRVQAAMGSGETGSVLIDGEITPVGEHYRDVLIRKITPQGVLLEYQGEERMVRVRR